MKSHRGMNQLINAKEPPLLCSICLPVYNEEESLPFFLNELVESLNVFERSIGIDFEIIAVDDGSIDASLSILKD